MKILAICHGYPPTHAAGAEQMLHAILRGLMPFGVQARVITGAGQNGPWSGTLDGVEVLTHPPAETLQAWIQDCDVMMTHLDRTREVIGLAQRFKKPLVHLVHNPHQLDYFGVRPSADECALAVMNSQHLTASYAWPGQQVLVRPPVRLADYQVPERLQKGIGASGSRDGAITLINLSKGGKLFWELAKRFPEREFLGVLGAYGVQFMPPRAKNAGLGNPERGATQKLDNVTILQHGPDMRRVYRKTRLLLVPSEVESWGRVAVEACCSGIPVISSGAIGLRESLSGAGVAHLAPGDVNGWAQAIQELDDADRYREASYRALQRAQELDEQVSLDLLALWDSLRVIVAQWGQPEARARNFTATTMNEVRSQIPAWRTLSPTQRGWFQVPPSLLAESIALGITVAGNVTLEGLTDTSVGEVLVRVLDSFVGTPEEVRRYGNRQGHISWRRFGENGKDLGPNLIRLPLRRAEALRQRRIVEFVTVQS